MDTTTEVGALLNSHLQRKNTTLLLNITIVNPCASFNLENAAPHAGENLDDAAERKKTKYRGSFIATLPPFSRFVDVRRGWLRRACPHRGARHQTGRAQVGDTLHRVPVSGGGNESSTSSATIIFCFTVGTFIPQASSSLQTGSGACGHPTALFARPGVCAPALY